MLYAVIMKELVVVSMITQVAVMSYSAKFASTFYGPFRYGRYIHDIVHVTHRCGVVV